MAVSNNSSPSVMFSSDSSDADVAMQSHARDARCRKLSLFLLVSGALLSFVGCYLLVVKGGGAQNPAVTTSAAARQEKMASPVVAAGVPPPVAAFTSPTAPQSVEPTLAIPSESVLPQCIKGGDASNRAEYLTDGNVCRDTEELYGGVCYRKCECFMNVAGAVRKSAFSCCNPLVADCSNDLDFLKWSTPSLVPCEGYAVSSADDTSACSHLPGACRSTDEQNFQMCYKKCSSFDSSAYPFRVAAATCCAVDPKVDIFACLPFFGSASKTDAKYNIGGGCDDSNPGAPCLPYLPLLEQTEVQGSVTSV